MSEYLDRPNRIPWPPILLALALAGAYAGRAALSVAGLGPAQTMAGFAVAGAGIGLIGWAFVTFGVARANILPHRAADRLITSGPFAWSRNPIYLGEVVVLAGLALAWSSLAPALAALGLGVAVSKLAIEREEAHLDARFGDAWRDYAATVRRWGVF